VAILTYKRGDLLDKLLAECSGLEKSDTFHQTLLVIDNDPDSSAKPIVDRHRATCGEIRYAAEARRGIPIARNRALDEALAMDADVLCFIDDDEYPDTEWLCRLVECWQTTGAHLVGGPVEVTDPPAAANRWQRFINASLAERMRRKNRITAQRAKRGKRYAIVTNNWLCDLAWQRRSNVRFDETMLVSGGSDTAFYRAARAAGAVPEWCAGAVVYETMTLDRLSLVYQFIRGAAQSNVNFQIKRPTMSVGMAAAQIPLFATRFVLAFLLLIVPVYGIASLVIAVRSMGWSVGRAMALIGVQSTLYK
jgi:glycosyltransferase involved in cell wall biosynthesis